VQEVIVCKQGCRILETIVQGCYCLVALSISLLVSYLNQIQTVHSVSELRRRDGELSSFGVQLKGERLSSKDSRLM
jgi:hypothetical protein